MIRNKPTTAELVQDLGRIKDIDAMLQEGMSATDVADFIQDTLGEIRHVDRVSLANILRERSKSLPPPEMTAEEFPAAACPAAHSDTDDYPEPPRRPGKIARSQYKKAKRGVDELLELESLYIAQRDRIDWLMGLEATENIPMPTLTDEISAARKILVDMADVRQKAGPSMARMGITLEIGTNPGAAMQSSINSVMSNPSSRHRVLTLVEKFKRLAALPQHVVDADAEPVKIDD